MKDNRNNYFDWQNINSKAQEVLGEDFWSEINRVLPRRGPSVDIYRTNNEIVILIEMPGVWTPQNINIKMKCFKLFIQGDIPWTYPVGKEDLIQSERFIGSFKREIALPQDISPNGIADAQFKNGLLEIHIPRIQGQDEKEIPIDFSD